MPSCHRSHNKESQSSSFHAPGQGVWRPVEALEYALQLLAWYADSVVAHAQPDGIDIGRQDFHDNILFLPRVLDSIFEEIEDRGAQFLSVPHHRDAMGWLGAKMQCFRR